MKTELKRRIGPSLYVAFFGLLGFVASASIGLTRGIPIPIANDEFSYLLAADTFAHGRITNPPHPLWIHFETSHTIQQPTYMSKYPPAQGLVLALGQTIGGKPIWGVWLSFGLMSAAVYWMLYAWLPQRYAIAGGIFAVFNPILGASGYWAQSYWGGTVAATGGALALGAARKTLDAPRWQDALALACGFAVLANSRPYEGLLFSVAILASLAWQRVPMRRALLPLAAVTLLTAGWIGFYNFRVTGSPFRMAYHVYSEQYDVAPKFIFERLRPQPEFRHAVFRDRAYDADLRMYEVQRSLMGFALKNVVYLCWWLWSSLNVLLLTLIIGLPALARWMRIDSGGRMTLVICAVFAFGVALEVPMMLHYLAPTLGLSYLLALQAARSWRWPYAVRTISSLVVLAFAMSLYLHSDAGDEAAWYRRRADVLQELKEIGGRHLILVRYGTNHHPAHEWVHNRADIDAAQVVWARDPDRGDSCELIRYFNDRRIWKLAADLPEGKLLAVSAGDMCPMNPQGQSETN